MEDKSQILHKTLVDKQLYSKSYDEFLSQFSDDEKRQKLYGVLVDKKLYSKPFDEFSSQFFPVKKKDSSLTDIGQGTGLVSEDLSKPSEVSLQEQPPLPSELQTPDLTLQTPELGGGEEIPNYLEIGGDIPRPQPEKAKTVGEAIGATLGEFGRSFGEMFGDFGKLGTKIQDEFASIFLNPEESRAFKKMREAGVFVPPGGITSNPSQHLSNLLARATVNAKELPGGVIGDVTRGMIHIVPDLVLAAGAPELLFPKVFSKIGLTKLGKFGFEQGFRGMVEGMDQAENAPWNLQISIPVLTSFERGITGWMYEGLGHSASLVGQRMINKLIPNAKTIGESLNKSLLQKGTTALTNGLYFMGFGGLDEFARTGQVSKENLFSSFGMGFAFSMPEMGNLLYAKGINSFIAAPREGLNNIYKSDVSAKKLSEKSIELAKSVEEGKSENPESDAVTAFMLNKTSQLKAFVDEVKENPKEIIKSIDESTLESKVKELITDKVNEVIADNDVNIQKTKEYTDDITLLDGALDKIRKNKSWSEGRKEAESAPLKRKREELKKKELEVYGIKEPEPKEGEGEKKKEPPLTKEDKTKIDEVLKKEEITKVEEEIKDAETIRRETEEAGRPQELVEGEEGGLRVRDAEKDRLETEQREEIEFTQFKDVVKQSKTVDEAFRKVQEIKDVPTETAEVFRNKYDPNKTLTPEQAFEKFYNEIKAKEAEIKPAKAEEPRKEVGVKFKDKSYTSVEEVQDDFADKKITFEENKKLLYEVNKFEDRLKKEARTTSDNTYKRIDNLTRNAEETLQKEINDKKSKLYSKFLPDIIAPISNLLYKPLVKIKDRLANSIAGELKKGVTTQNDALRWTTKVITNLYNGLVRTQEDMFGKGEEGKIGKLEMTGTTRTYARYKAKNLLKAWRDAVNSDNEALKRVWQVLDTELGTKAGETPLTEKDLNPSEQNLLKTLREWNTWVWSTNQANGITPTKSYLKFKGDFDKTGYSDYIARMYDKYEESTILSPEIREFVSRGNSSVTSKMVTDYMKLRKELVGAVEIDGKLYETIEELQQGLRDGEINRDQYNEVKDQIKSKEWRQEHAVKDPAYLTAKRVMQTIQNVAIKQYMDMIISQHPEYVLDVKKGEEMPKGYTKLSSSYSWGPFRNKVVVDHIVEDFTGFFYKNATVNALYDGIKLLDRSNLNQFYKRWRTIYNPFVQVGNITGNVFFASVNGMNPVRFIAKMATSLNMDKKNLALYELLLKSGLMGDVAMTGEMKLEQISQPGEGIVKEIAKKIINKPMQWYAGADNVAKMAAYRIHREDGFTHEQAIKRTYDAFQNYSTVGKTWDLTSKIPAIGPTFVKFQADLQRIMLNNMLTAPLTTIGTFMLIKALGNLASTLSGESEEEREIREHRTGVPRIPIVNVPLSFKVGKSELNVARYLTPLFIYPQGDNEMDISELSKFLPLQFQKKDKESLFPLPAFADATWGWLGSVLADRDFRMMAIQDPYSRRYKDVGITKDERRLNVLEFAMRSQVPFYKGTTDIIDGITGQLDYYGRNRTWQQSILNNIIKIQQFDKPELKLYMESRINYLTNRYTTLAQVAGNANKEVLTQIKKAEDKKLSKEAIDKIYEKELNISNKREQYALDRQIPILDELERLMNVYKKWNPEDEFVSSSFTEIEAGKMQLFRVLDEKDFMTKHKVEYKLLKDNNLLKRPDEIPTVYNGVILTDVQKKRYMEEYWSTYLMYLDELIGLTQEDMNAAKEVITSMKPSKTKLKMEEENLLNKNSNEARRRAIQSAELVLGELIK